MSISDNTLITSAGLDLATSASNDGPLVAIKYFLPSYDYRIDPNVYTTGHTPIAIDLSASMDTTDSDPYGELIYNIDESSNAYSLTESDNIIVSAGSETVTDRGSFYTIENPVVTNKDNINLYNGVALSNHFSGTDVTYNSNDYPNAFKVVDYDTVVGDNSIPSEVLTGNARFFSVTDYYPVSADNERLKGSWKCRLSKNIGEVKFNKIGLYAVQVDTSGNEVGSPVLFAESAMSEPITKTSFGTDGFDDIVIDVQIQLGSIQNSFSDVFFSTSGDYWARTPNGVTYPEKVNVGVFNDNEDPEAKLNIREDQDQISIGYDINNEVTISLEDNDGPELHVKTNKDTGDTKDNPLYTTFGGDISLHNIHTLGIRQLEGNAPKANSKDPSRINLFTSLYPLINDEFTIGTDGKNLKSISTNNITASGGTTTISSNIVPTADKLFNVGATNKKIKTVHAETILSTELVSSNISATTIKTSNLIINDVPIGTWSDLTISDDFANNSNFDLVLYKVTEGQNGNILPTFVPVEDVSAFYSRLNNVTNVEISFILKDTETTTAYRGYFLDIKNEKIEYYVSDIIHQLGTSTINNDLIPVFDGNVAPDIDAIYFTPSEFSYSSGTRFTLNLSYRAKA